MVGAFFLRLLKGGGHSRVSSALLGLLLSATIFGFAEAQLKPTRRVLIFYEIGLSSPSVSILDQEIRSALERSPFQIELYREYLETTLFPEPSAQKEIRDWDIHKYRNLKPDIVVAVGPSPLRFLADSHQQFFRGVPVVFGGVSGMKVDVPGLNSHFTGVWDIVEPAKTLETALRLRPATRHVIVVGGQDAFDLELEAWFHEQLRGYESKLEFTYLTDLSMPQLVQRLSRLPANSIVLLTHIGLDAAGTRFVGASQADPLVVRAANAPVFGPSDVDLGHGEVGGYLDSFAMQGRMMGDMLTRILDGEKPQNIPIVTGSEVYMFDWKALKRWGMKEENLPPGSVVLNRQPTVWKSYKSYIIAGMTLILIEGILIGGLIWQRARRRETNRALQKRTMESQAREELLNIFVKNVPAGVAMLDQEMRYLQVSDRWCADYGVDAAHILGRSHYEVFPDMPEHWREIHHRALAGETLRADEERWERNGGIIWLRWEVRPWLKLDAQPGGILIFAEDITRRKQADEALSGVNRKLIESQEQERARIGRELHDDINQRLAMLAVELDVFDQSGSAKDLHGRIREFKQRVIDIATGVQALSHQLHSSKLEYLGLAVAARSFCKELSDMHNVRIDFTQNGVPRNLPEDVSICLFRVLQEALQNAVKYSGTDHFEVDLFGTSADIRLMILDDGRGFNLDEAMKTNGLGLVSMRERVSLVKGEITIGSKPMMGTKITVRVPVTADRASEVKLGAA